MRILIVTHFFPPLNSVASLRPYGWARAWQAEGHEVHVLTPAKYGYDGAADLELPEPGAAVHEVAYLAIGAGTSAGDRWPWLKTATRGLRAWLGPAADPRNLAYGPMMERGRVLLAAQRFDVLIGSASPVLAHRVTRDLARESGVPWVADFRDHWDYEARAGSPVAAWRRRAQRRQIEGARLASTVSHGLAERLSAELGRAFLVSYNGYVDGHPAASRKAGDKFELVYTGRFYPRRRDPRPLFDALARALAADGRFADRFVLHLYGHTESWLSAAVAQSGVGSLVQFHGAVPYARSLAAQADADALLFVDWHDRSFEGVLTGKLFEYLQSGRPIVAMGERGDTEAMRIIRDCRAGVELLDERALDGFLAAPQAATAAVRPDAERIAGFSRAAQARALLASIRGGLGAP